MNTHADTQLKQALAKMLVEQVYSCSYGNKFEMFWRLDGVRQREVLDTELLHLCWMVEETIKRPSGCMPSLWYLELRAASDNNEERASWQQRTIALCKVKGVEIV